MAILQVISDKPNMVAKISGKIDAVNSRDIQSEAVSLIDDSLSSFTFDMNDVTYVSSAGLRMFSSVAKSCKDIGIEYILAGLREDIVRMFKMTGYSSRFRIEMKEEGS